MIFLLTGYSTDSGIPRKDLLIIKLNESVGPKNRFFDRRIAHFSSADDSTVRQNSIDAAVATGNLIAHYRDGTESDSGLLGPSLQELERYPTVLFPRIKREQTGFTSTIHSTNLNDIQTIALVDFRGFSISIGNPDGK